MGGKDKNGNEIINKVNSILLWKQRKQYRRHEGEAGLRQDFQKMVNIKICLYANGKDQGEHKTDHVGNKRGDIQN